MDEGGIWMSKKGAVGYEIITDYLVGKFSRTEAAQMLEVRERTITRMARRIREKGLSGAVHANRGRAPACKLPAIFKAQVMKTMKEKYRTWRIGAVAPPALGPDLGLIGPG